MGIHDMKEAAGKDERGRYILHDLTMRTEEGGKIQVFKCDGQEIKFKAMTPMSEIIAAFKDQK